MKIIVAVIINMFFPGMGTLIVGKVGIGLAQIILTIVAGIMLSMGFLSILGVLIALGVWIWALVSVAGLNTTETIIVKDLSTCRYGKRISINFL